MKKESQRTSMPFDNRSSNGSPSISPPTSKSILPTNNIHTIQDVLDGRRYDSLHGGGSWSSGEDVDKSYREDADHYKRQERDLDIIRKMVGKPQDQQKWKIKFPGGSISFMSFDLAQQYVRQHGFPYSYLTRVAQNDNTKIVAETIDKCFLVESIDAEKGVKDTGSAFCVYPNHFVTCAHVIRKYDKSNINNVSNESFKGPIVNLLQLGNRHVAEVIAIDPQMDIAILKAEIDVSPLEISTNVNVGNDVICIGSPHGYENNISAGIVGSMDRTIFSYPDAPKYMFVDLSVFPGNSGGPVINNNGEVVGMVTMIISSGTGNYGLNAALPSNYIIDFCNKMLEGFSNKG